MLAKEVLRAVGDHGDMREKVLSRFKENGGDIQRRKRADMAAMCDALTSVEDKLEFTRFATARSAVRGVRRRLELELWP